MLNDWLVIVDPKSMKTMSFKPSFILLIAAFLKPSLTKRKGWSGGIPAFFFEKKTVKTMLPPAVSYLRHGIFNPLSEDASSWPFVFFLVCYEKSQVVCLFVCLFWSKRGIRTTVSSVIHHHPRYGPCLHLISTKSSNHVKFHNI